MVNKLSIAAEFENVDIRVEEIKFLQISCKNDTYKL